MARHFSRDQLKSLFELNDEAASDTHAKLNCQRCLQGREIADPPPDADTNSDLVHWFHVEKDAKKMPDQVLRRIHSPSLVTFVFYQKSHEQLRIKGSQEEEERDEDYQPDGEDEPDDQDDD